MEEKLRGVFGLALLPVGLGIGWLAGLSVSPVISIVVTSVVGAAAAIVGTLAGTSQPDTSQTTGKRDISPIPVNVSAMPLMWLIIGLVIGSSLGVLARTHNWLGQNPSVRIWSRYGITLDGNELLQTKLEDAIVAEIDFWEHLGLDRARVAEGLFELRYSFANQADQQVEHDFGTPGLFSAFRLSQSECETLQNQSSGNLRFEMERREGKLRVLSETLTADEPELKTLMDIKLEEVVNLLCTPES